MIRLGKFDKQGYKDSFSKGELARELVCMNNDYDKLEKENQKYKEVIEKAKEWVERKINSCTIEANSTTTDTMCRITIVGLTNLLDILKEVEHE